MGARPGAKAGLYLKINIFGLKLKIKGVYKTNFFSLEEC